MVPARVVVSVALAAVAGLAVMTAPVVRAAARQAAASAGDAARVAEIVRASGAYLMDLEAKYGRVIGDERYTQTLRDRRPASLGLNTTIHSEQRVLMSEVVASVDPTGRWIALRDVYRVDGHDVRDRDQRLQKLFSASGAAAAAQTRRIADESARFNIGAMSRNVNVPSMPLTFLRSDSVSRSTFTLGGADRLDGVDVVELRFTEASVPTFIRSMATDLPASGTFWIDPKTGAVHRAAVSVTSRDLSLEMTVTFGWVEKLKLWLPKDMRDDCSTQQEFVSGHATYTNYRQFETASVVIK